MTLPLVTVCIPTFNRPDGLRRTLEHVCNQTYTNLEIIVRDNCSTNPESYAVLEEFKQRDCRIQVLYGERNLGPTPNFELARSLATGKYYLWCADDDYIDANYIESCVRSLEMDSKLTLVSGSFRSLDAGETLEFRPPKALASKHLWIRVSSYLIWVQQNYIFYGVYRRSDLGEFPILNQLGGDWSFVVRQMLCGGVLVLEGSYINCNKVKSASQSTSSLQITLNLPKWTAKFPRIAITHTVIKDTLSALRYLKGENMFRDIRYGMGLAIVLSVRWPLEFILRRLLR